MLYLAESGIECPGGKACGYFCKGGSRYYFDKDELSSMVKYGENVKNNAKKHKRSDAEIEAANEPKPLNKKPISGYNTYATEICGISVNSFAELDAHIKKSVFSRAEADKLWSRLSDSKTRDDGKNVDPYVLSTTKACPNCAFRSSHFHGHRCHVRFLFFCSYSVLQYILIHFS